MKQRLQKIISGAGLASRRAAEEMILAGRIRVNGETAGLGMSANPETDEITVDGKKLKMNAEKVYIMLNKPRGYVTTLSDEKGRRTVAELVADAGRRLYPVGRLDLNSEGLLIMTDDGEAANALMHPSHNVAKTYRVEVEGENIEDACGVLRSPLVIDGYRIRPAEVAAVGSGAGRTALEITIHEGRNRQVRKMCELAGLRVLRLTRVSEGELRLGSLQTGKWRYLTDKETDYVRNTENK